MRKRLTIWGAVLAALALGVYMLAPSASASPGKAADHSLFDETGGDLTVFCRTTNGGAFDVHMAFRAIDGDAVLRLTFQDSDYIDYPIPQDTSFSLTEAAGTSFGVDKRVTASNAGTAPGKLVGWMSAGRLPATSTEVLCNVTTAA